MANETNPLQRAVVAAFDRTPLMRRAELLMRTNDRAEDMGIDYDVPGEQRSDTLHKAIDAAENAGAIKTLVVRPPNFNGVAVVYYILSESQLVSCGAEKYHD